MTTHLDSETLARLADEAPSPTEAAHLAACGECAAEREALAEQTTLLGSLGPLAPPAAAWERLEGELCSAGLVRGAESRRAWLAPSLRAAAALVVLLGAAAVFTLWGGTAPEGKLALRPAQPAAEQRPSPGVAPAASPAPAVSTPAPEAAPPPARPRVALRRATLARFAGESRPPAAAEAVPAVEAAALQSLAEYIAAAAPTADTDPLEQLAAWEGITLFTGDAVERLPASAAANGYHLLALRQRDAVLRQVAVNTNPTWH